jgi:hypothetical protein
MLRLRNVNIVDNLSYLILYPQAEEKVWSNPGLKERTTVNGEKTLNLTGKILRRLDHY